MVHWRTDAKAYYSGPYANKFAFPGPTGSGTRAVFSSKRKKLPTTPLHRPSEMTRSGLRWTPLHLVCCLLLFPIVFTHLLSRDAGTRSWGVGSGHLQRRFVELNLSSKLGPHHRDKRTGMPSVTEEAASHTTLNLDGVAAGLPSSSQRGAKGGILEPM